MTPTWTQHAPRWPKMTHAPKDGPKWPSTWAHVGHNMASTCAKLATTWPNIPPAWPHFANMLPQHSPYIAPHGPNTALPPLFFTCFVASELKIAVFGRNMVQAGTTWPSMSPNVVLCLCYVPTPAPPLFFYSVFWRLAFANRLPHHRPWPHMARSWQHAPRKAPTWPQSQHGLNIGATWCKMAAEPSAWSILPSSLFLLENHVFYSVFWHQHGPNLSP